MKNIIVIPARYGSTRLPGKPLRMIAGKPLIQWVYEGAKRSLKKDGIIVATDHIEIMERVISFGGEAIMTGSGCKSGTDRVYEAIKDKKGGDIIVNVQGDEPFIRPDMIDTLFELMEREHHEMATLCTPIKNMEEYKDPNTVKVVLDRSSYALYFSRSPIPYLRGKGTPPYLFKHIGIYAFTKSFLEKFVSMDVGLLEEMESLEQLRALENGYRIKVLLTEYEGFGIDIEEDIIKAEAILSGLKSRE
ncbi:MAG: 3-deoxy-manno-octulosonate cytidylyltransferase [Syntrophorhabdaceae bacterium]|nr:3-deoxy-manno-octulosonate cytidylyltransferase [Syntrophorhabdaceae bacterium]